MTEHCEAKLLNDGFIIIRRDVENLVILAKNSDNRSWFSLERYQGRGCGVRNNPLLERLNSRADDLLENPKIIEACHRMTTRDQNKIIDAGFVVIRGSEPELVIRFRSSVNREWRILENGFASKAALQRRMKELLDDPLTISLDSTGIIKVRKDDLRCLCSAGDKCLLGKTGMSLRCHKSEIESAGFDIDIEE